MSKLDGPGGRQRCPICGEPTELAFRPFCSRRCADVDLSRWLSGVYVIAGRDDADDDEDGDAVAARMAVQSRRDDDVED